MFKEAAISDLRDYSNVLSRVEEGALVYLTQNGQERYSIHDIRDEKRFEKTEAMIQLLCELNEGLESAKNGWVTEDELTEHFQQRRKGLS